MSLNVLDVLSEPLKHNFLNFFCEYMIQNLQQMTLF